MCCLLAEIHPEVAQTGQAVVLEGSFGPTVTVNFPGGATAAATLLGPTRATVAVPAGASAGTVSVTTNGMTVGAVPFHRTSFPLGLGAFGRHYEQTATARSMPGLAADRSYHACAVTGSRLHVLGGSTAAAEDFRINADGTMDALGTGATPKTARLGASTFVTGGYLYVIGGRDPASATPMTTVERAPINADGSLGAFADAGISLVTARSGITVEVIGPYLYVVGGADTEGYLQSLERAPILPNGQLGAFAMVAPQMVTGHEAPSLAVTRGYLYVIGGSGESRVERAPINASDGSLGTFALAGNLLASRESGTAWVLGSTLYVAGGNQFSVESSAIAADGSLGAFSNVVGLSATQRTGSCGVLVGDGAYLIGGTGQPSFERSNLSGGTGIGPFAATPGSTLTAGRYTFGTAVLGQNFYVFGGYNGAGVVGTVERSIIAADGTPGPFQTVTGVAFVKPRGDFAAFISGSYLYVVGGFVSGTPATPLGDIERAPIAADGTLGAFSAITTAALSTTRYAHRLFAAGSALFAIGGIAPGGTTRTIDQAAIAADHSIGKFANSTATLQVARYGQAQAFTGSQLLELSGIDSSAVPSSEHSSAAADGSLGPFSTTGPGVAMARGNAYVAIIGRSLLVLGGGGGGTRTDYERAALNVDGSLGGFATAGSFAQSGGTALVLGNNLYVVGGLNSSVTALVNVDRAEIR
jgi:hypothetical protein